MTHSYRMKKLYFVLASLFIPEESALLLVDKAYYGRYINDTLIG